jgi:hypothetical protein
MISQVIGATGAMPDSESHHIHTYASGTIHAYKGVRPFSINIQYMSCSDAADKTVTNQATHTTYRQA